MYQILETRWNTSKKKRKVNLNTNETKISEICHALCYNKLVHEAKDLSKKPPATKCLSDEKLHDIRLAPYVSKQPCHNQIAERYINWCQKHAKK